MAVLCDASIEYGAKDDEVRMIEPYDPERLQPASYDLTLGSTFRVFDLASTTAVRLSDPSTFRDLTREVRVPEGDEFVLHPGQFALAATLEVVRIPRSVVGRLEGKSSLARLALMVHATGGFIDPGFSGNITLEMLNFLGAPIVMEPGQAIAQISFIELDRPALRGYEGRYQGDEGAVASRYGMDRRLALETNRAVR